MSALGVGEPVTYSRDVAPILQAKCQECHRPEGMAPFSLSTYRDARSWSKMIAEVVETERMPPWYAVDGIGEWKNDRSLTPEEKATLLEWIASHGPRGRDEELPPPRTFASGWQLGPPDLVFEMPEAVSIDATGVVPYVYRVTPNTFTEDVWISGVEIQPGNPKVVHHIGLYLMPPGTHIGNLAGVFNHEERKSRAQGRGPFLGPGKSFLASYVPGCSALKIPDGAARKIPKGWDILWEIHYTPTGKPETDRSKFGIRFASGPVVREFVGAAISNYEFLIPPNTPDHRVETPIATAPEDSVVYGFFPHMHFRGKSFEYRFQYPDGREEVVCAVARYDFNWQLTYELKQPKFIPKGTKIRCIAHFDNSANNPANPDPSKEAVYGEQTWDEMMIGWVFMSWALDGSG